MTYGSCDRDDVGFCFLECDAVQSGRSLRNFRISCYVLHQGMCRILEASQSSDTSVHFD